MAFQRRRGAEPQPDNVERGLKMFTGLIERVGVVEAMESRTDGGTLRLTVSGPWSTPLLEGESIAVQGVCLTVTAIRAETILFDVLDETLKCTNLGGQRVGSRLNLERALPANGRFGGHMVSGHVDGTGWLEAVRRVGRDYALTVACDEALTQDIIVKGSIALDGISLTVTAVSAGRFEVHIIPHTWTHTALENAVLGQRLNLETDMTAKYIRHYLVQMGHSGGEPMTLERLRSAGF